MIQKTAREEIDFRALAEFRYALRKFQAFSETAAEGAGLTPQQHQALLAITGFGGSGGLSVGHLAERLLVRHNTAAELVNRLEAAGLAARGADEEDARRAPVQLTPEGRRRLRRLSRSHLAELRVIRPVLKELLEQVDAVNRESGPFANR